MQIKFSVPPKWEEISKKFNVTTEDLIFYTHGDTIYSPAKIIPTDDIIKHEGVHAEQQGHDDSVGNLWWERYIRDPQFRLDQEAEAYGTQYRFICDKYKDRNKRAQYLIHMAKSLSGPIYGRCISIPEALKVIREFADHGRPELYT